MGKILETLFNGNLSVDPIPERRTPEHQKACDYAYHLVDELSETLDPDGKTLLDKMIEAMHRENEYYAMDRFVRGYALGALMLLEVMEKQDEFLLGQEP